MSGVVGPGLAHLVWVHTLGPFFMKNKLDESLSTQFLWKKIRQHIF